MNDAMPAEMREVVEVKVTRPFGLGERMVAVGEVVSVPRHRAEYLVFLRLAEWL